jgi:hypothetical protein
MTYYALGLFWLQTPLGGNAVLMRKPARILCKCEALASLRYAQLGVLLSGPGGY